jgi:hypothetical protein
MTKMKLRLVRIVAAHLLGGIRTTMKVATALVVVVSADY